MAGETQVTLMAVGDIMLGDCVCTGYGVGSKIKKMGANYPFLQVASALRGRDIFFGNLEAVLSNSAVNRKNLSSIQMRASPCAVEGLTYAGFNILSLANNHILEHGEEALSLFNDGIKTLRVKLKDYDVGDWSYYDILGHRSDKYHQLHCQQLFELYSITGEPQFLHYAEKWYSYMYKNNTNP